jgi:hypothetical protein
LSPVILDLNFSQQVRKEIFVGIDNGIDVVINNGIDVVIRVALGLSVVYI